MTLNNQHREDDYSAGKVSEVTENHSNANGKYTKHMNDRMRQRNIRKEAVDMILNMGEFNKRGDRIQLSKKLIRAELQQAREKINTLEKLLRRNGATLVVDNNIFITVYTNTKRVFS